MNPYEPKAFELEGKSGRCIHLWWHMFDIAHNELGDIHDFARLIVAFRELLADQFDMNDAQQQDYLNVFVRHVSTIHNRKELKVTTPLMESFAKYAWLGGPTRCFVEYGGKYCFRFDWRATEPGISLSMTLPTVPTKTRKPRMNIYMPTEEEASTKHPDYIQAWKAFAFEAYNYPKDKSFTDYLYDTAVYGREQGYSFQEIEEVLNNQRLFMTEVACRKVRPKAPLLDSFLEYSKKVARHPVFVVCSKELSFVYYAFEGAERITVLDGDTWIKEEHEQYLAA